MPNTVLQPSLIIGLGGSGIEVVRRFKRRFSAIYPDTPYVRLLGIDTAPQSLDSDASPQLSDDEFVWAAGFDMQHYVGPGYIDNHPAIRAFWKGYEQLPLKHVQQGAGMRRPVGRLAFFVEYQNIMARLRHHLNAMFSNSVFHDLPPQYRKSVVVYIAASTCGGTGTGMFLDLAFLARKVVPETIPGAQAKVRALLALPSAFLGTGTVKPQEAAQLRANAFGALSELDACMSKDVELADVQYPAGNAARRAEAPFQSCFLIGNQTAQAAVWSSYGALMELAATQIHIDIASPLFATGEQRMDNILQAIAAKPDSRGRPRLYSSFANDWIELPSARLFARWRKALARRVVERLRNTARSEEADLFDALTQEHAYGRLRSLLRGQGLNDFMPKVNAAIDYFMDLGTDGLNQTELMSRAEALRAEAAKDLASSQALPRLVDDLLKAARPIVHDLLAGALADRSIAHIRDAITRTISELERWLDDAQQSIGQHQADAWFEEFAGKVSELKKGLLTGKSSFANAQRQLVIDAVEKARDAWRRALRARVSTSLTDALPHFIRDLRELRIRLDELSAALDDALRLIESLPEPTVPQGSQATFSDPDIDRAFADQARVQAMELALHAYLPHLVDPGSLVASEVARRLVQSVDHAVRAVATDYIRTLAIPSHEIADRLQKLSPLAVFRADFAANPDRQDLQELCLVGLPETSRDKQGEVRDLLSPVFQAVTEFVPHGDEERVVMTTQLHGFPLYALAEVEDCRAAFHAADPSDKPLRFVFPDTILRDWDMAPVAAEESHMWFAIALAMGKVRRNGQRYVLNTGTAEIDFPEHANPVEARSLARDSFLRGGSASIIKRHCRSLLKEGNQVLYDKLQAWVTEQRTVASNEADYPADFHSDIDRVADYAKSIRPF